MRTSKYGGDCWWCGPRPDGRHLDVQATIKEGFADWQDENDPYDDPGYWGRYWDNYSAWIVEKNAGAPDVCLGHIFGAPTSHTDDILH